MSDKIYQFNLVEDEHIKQVASWVRAGRGLYRWESQDLSCPRGDIVTPADVTRAPHWAYAGHPIPMDPKDVAVEYRTYHPIPVEWSPRCEKCQGSKVRTVAEMAGIWKTDIEDATARMAEPSWTWGPVTDGTFPCNYCQGTGHKPEVFTVRVEDRGWFGVHFYDTSKRKIAKMGQKLREHAGLSRSFVMHHDWEWYDKNIVTVKFYLLSIETLACYVERTRADYEFFDESLAAGGGDLQTQAEEPRRDADGT